MKILGIETSCDETGAAVVENGVKLLSNVVSSSQDLHKKYGGIVPEIAAREQVKIIIAVIQEALDEAKTRSAEFDAIAVTIGPGLIGSLLVGVETAKTLSFISNKPIIPLNHLLGHIYANWMEQRPPKFPIISLIVSGGHTDLLFMENHGVLKWLGGTRDDAAGEAFDKVARILGLSYPGGPEIEKIAKDGDPTSFIFPRPMIDSPDFDFSFSGLKTSVVNLVNNFTDQKTNQFSRDLVANIAASFQTAIFEVLIKKTLLAAKKCAVSEIVVGGGVAANKFFKKELRNQSSIPVRFPPIELAVDNAAMIASCAYFNFRPGKITEIQAQPGLYF